MGKNLKKLLTILLTIFITFSLFVTDKAEAANENNSRVVKVGVSNWNFFYGVNNKDFYPNYVTDYFAKLTKITGLKFEYVNGSLKQVMKKLAEGKIDLVFGSPYTKEFRQKYAYIRPEVFTKNVDIIVLKKDGEKNNLNEQIKELKGPEKVFGIINKDNKYYKELLRENINKNEEVKFKYYESIAEAIVAVKKREIDYIIATNYIKIDDTLKKVGTLTQAKYYLIADVQKEDLINTLSNAAYQIEIDDGTSNRNLIGENKIFNNSVVLNLTEENALAKLPILTFYVPKDRLFYYKKDKDGYETGIYANYMSKLSKILNKDYEVIQIDPNELALQKKTGFYVDVLRSYKTLPNSYGAKELSNALIKAQVLFVVKKQVESFGNTKESLTYVSCDPGYLSMFAKNTDKFIITKNDEESLNLVADNKADVAIVGYFSGYYLNSMARYKDISLAGIESNISRALLIVNSNDPNLKSAINKAIEKIPENEFRLYITKESKKHVYKPTIQEEFKENFGVFISILSILLLTVFLVITVLINKNKKIEELASFVNKASAVKDDFLSRISHDMRTPLNAIISYSEFGIEETKNLNNKGYFTYIKENSLELLNLMKDVLELQRLNNLGNRFEKNSEVVFLSASVFMLREKICLLAKRKGIEFVFEETFRKKGIKYIKVNKELLNQVLSNILLNALKYTPVGGTVKWTIDIIEDEDGIKIKHVVDDNGLGISPEFQKIMFDAFTVSDNTLTNNAHGTGLGLAISKTALDILGGKIICKSIVNFGTAFIITIPVGTVSEDEIREYKAKNENNNFKNQLNSKSLNSTIAKKRNESFAKLKNLKVLLCEDQIINAKIIEKIFEVNKIELTWAKNGFEGLDLFKTNRYDLILMDVRMPIMDGLVATREIRKIDKEIPILGLSGASEDKEVKEALDAGMNDYLEKPVDKKILLEKIMELTEK